MFFETLMPVTVKFGTPIPVLSKYLSVLQQSVTITRQILSNLLKISQLKPNYYHSSHSRTFEFPPGNSNLLVKFSNSMLFVMEQFRPELNTVETLTADGKLFFSTELLGEFVATIRAFEVSD